MKRVSLKELKQDLASWTELASQGTPIEVTKHQKPFIMLMPWNPSHLEIGTAFGKSFLTGCLDNATNGKWLEILQEDREENDKG